MPDELDAAQFVRDLDAAVIAGFDGPATVEVAGTAGPLTMAMLLELFYGRCTWVCPLADRDGVQAVLDGHRLGCIVTLVTSQYVAAGSVVCFRNDERILGTDPAALPPLRGDG